MAIEFPYCSPEIWGGIECTINRLNDQYCDQLQLSNHYGRPEDIQRIAKLGIRKLRYPVLWEKHQPGRDTNIDWDWAERQLNSIREKKIVPVVGLLHHGSGPRFTNLADEKFPELFAAYAGQVAAKFPWLTYYTPVNEPLTTARFSGLYGYWYPHAADEKNFFNILLNQVKAVVLAMQAIRQVNPVAMLVQTEDLSKTHSTSLLKYQASFENERRWLTYDLLCGKVDRRHFFWNYILSLGISPTVLEFFLENPCPPSVLGFNYYVTSERYLDEEMENYPACTHGGNGKNKYADTEAVQTGHREGVGVLLKEAWDRYQLPMAITECHLSCTREEQIRWFNETWETCSSLKKQGVNVQAVTAWSLLGAYNWNSLLTTQNNAYEPGVFDTSNNSIRATALAKMITSLAAQGTYDHPLLASRGWWHTTKTGEEQNMPAATKKQVPLLIIGKTGTLGKAFINICRHRNIAYIDLGRDDVNLLSEESIRAVIELHKPWAIINTSGYVRVDEAELHPVDCYAINTTAPALLATLCAEYGIRFTTFSSDLVFDGKKNAPYFERDATLPLNVYGASKAEAELQVFANNPSSLIIRTSAFFGPWDKANFVYSVLDSLEQGNEFCMPSDVIVSPTYVPDLCHAALDLLIDEESGIWHLTNDGMASWSELATCIARKVNIVRNKMVSKPLIEMGWAAPRPLYSVLQSTKGIKLPHFEDALNRFFDQRIA